MTINSNNSPIMNSFRVNTQNNMQRASERLSSGRRINSAADDAAGAAITALMNAQIRGTDMGTRNAADMGSLMRTAEGGLSSIGDSLQRMRELGLQATNGILTDDQRAMIQTEINQLQDHINRAASDTEFNTMPLLDGSFQNAHTASQPDGSGMSVSIDSALPGAIGIENFVPTEGNMDFSAIDSALNSVVGSRSELGAMMNANDFVISANNIASENLSEARSRIADADIAREMMALEQERIIQQYQTFMFRHQMERERDALGFVGMPW